MQIFLGTEHAQTTAFFVFLTAAHQALKTTEKSITTAEHRQPHTHVPGLEVPSDPSVRLRLSAT